MKPRTCDARGFTLVEVLVATTLLTIVMTAVYTLFFTVISTWRSEENDEGLHRRVRNALATLRHEYSNIHGSGGYYFEGGDDTFTMYTGIQPMDVEAGEGRHLMRVRYRYNRTSRTLIREEALLDAALPAVVENANTFDRGRIEVRDEESFVVATDVSHFSVRYLWVTRPDRAYWARKPVPVEPVIATHHRIGWGMPQAIEIELTIDENDSTSRPLAVTTRLPTRTFSRQHSPWELARLLEERP